TVRRLLAANFSGLGRFEEGRCQVMPQDATSTSVTQLVRLPLLVPIRQASPVIEIRSRSLTRKQHHMPPSGRPPGQPPPYWKAVTTAVPDLSLPIVRGQKTRT